MEEKIKRLRRHKALAVGCLVVMMIIYFGCVIGGKYGYDGVFWGGVKAFAEAGMVGAFADWFAVVALFKHPMGMPIPHTNIIENNKNSMGEGLGTFVTENFLTKENLRPYVERVKVSEFVLRWLGKEKNKDLIYRKIYEVIGEILDKVEEGKISEMVADKIIPEVAGMAERNKDFIEKKVGEAAPLLGFMSGGIATMLVNWFKGMIESEETRGKIIVFIQGYAGAKKDEVKKEFEKGEGKLVEYVRSYVGGYLSKIEGDDEFWEKLDGYFRYKIYKLAIKNSPEIGKIITKTVKEWDTKELSRKLELEVGSDLQFIRLNGTFVGGIVGLLIYILTNFII